MKRFIGGVLAAVFFGGAALVVGKTMHVAGKAGGTQGIAGTWQGVTNPLGQFPANTQRVNILLIGKDYNHTNKDIIYTKGSRSDTLILFSLDLQNKTISALSIPRDTYISERHGKINAAYAQGGAPLAVATVGKLLGVKPDYFVALKAEGLRAIVEQIGGVEVTALDKMKYDDNWGGLHIDLPAGTYTVNGAQAEGYTRFRKPNHGLPHSKEEGDSRRMARQQNLIRAMVAKAKTPAVLMSADKLIDVAFDQVETNLSHTQLLALATLFREAQPDKITSASLLGEDGKAGSMYVFKADPEKTKHLVDWLIRGNETAANAITVVSVENGTHRSGVAQHLADSLAEQGYDARSDGNAPISKPATAAASIGTVAPAAALVTSRIVYYKAAVAPRAQRIAQLLGVQNVAKEPLPIDKEVESTQLSQDTHPADVLVVAGDDIADKFAQPRSLGVR